jgi:hypothetical protein
MTVRCELKRSPIVRLHVGKAALTDSPANFHAVKHTNVTLVQRVQSEQALTSPVLTQCYERTHSENCFLHCENEGLHAIDGRGRNLNGKISIGNTLWQRQRYLALSQMLRK